MKTTNEIRDSTHGKYLAVDLDGTLFEHPRDKYPEIGEPKWNVIEYVKQKQNEGYKIILWTCRANNDLTRALLACKSVDLKLDAVNENPWFDTGSRKIYSSEYLDDRAVNVKDIKG